ncbi:hypothetical protein VNO77_02642 [Canavalia gladiata]|uniref:Uncharacterized protein n=1 Tax=Canavalia gladiata TaxID=3824 RepID=A0AAN9R7E5_CANGL
MMSHDEGCGMISCGCYGDWFVFISWLGRWLWGVKVVAETMFGCMQVVARWGPEMVICDALGICGRVWGSRWCSDYGVVDVDLGHAHT